MTSPDSETEPLAIFAAAPPGLEEVLLAEVNAAGFAGAKAVAGGVEFSGGWAEVMRANLELRGANRILVRIGSFRAVHLSQLDKRSRKLDWAAFLRADVPVKVEAVCRKSRIYHSGAASERVAKAIHAGLGASVSGEADLKVMVRIENDLVTVSVDTSGELLHRRGHKQAVNKAPLRETLAALFLRQCGYDGQEAVFDPMCGSGTFVIEAAEMALGLKPGRSRGFAFEQLAGFNAETWAKMKTADEPRSTDYRFFGGDRDAGAVRMSEENAARAGVDVVTSFEVRNVSDIVPPEGIAPGLVMMNPPYGGRIGDRKSLGPVYRALGQALRERFGGWRVGLVTSESQLAKATGLPFGPPSAPVDNGGIKVRLYSTMAL